MVNQDKVEQRLEAAQDRFTRAVAELHAALAELQAAALVANSPMRSLSEEDILTVGVSEAARIMNVSRQAIYRWNKSGKLAFHYPRPRSRPRISVADLRSLADEYQKGRR